MAIMELTSVHIRNFRSIDDCTLTFDPKCRVLVGINEAGKTNIIKALSLMDEAARIDPRDKREFKDNEPIDQTAFVDFYFKLNSGQKEAILKSIKSKFLSDNLDIPLLVSNNDYLDLATIINKHTQLRYRANLNTRKKAYSVKLNLDDPTVQTDWQKPGPTLSTDIFKSYYQPTLSPNEYTAINTSQYTNIPKEYFEALEVSEIIKTINSALPNFTNEMPHCIMWNYDEKNLLPSQISLSQFSQNPEVCVPLRNMFLLAGIQDIPKTIAEYQQRPLGIRNLLDRVSNAASEHLHKVWKEYKGIQILLTLNGDAVETAIKDKYKLYDLSRRSDGFKRFISFILLISMQAKSNTLSNTLLLYDEPEISLHPAGCRHLRDELIRISTNNHVVYSTHSIFMIDQNMTNRHYIVEKKNETTTIKEVNESNITDEEVLYNALNYSIFENLKKDNVIFEGWRDKHLFKIATSKLPTNLKSKKDILENLGYCHSKGVKNIAQITAMLELGKRNYLIITDSDKAAVEKQSEFQGEGVWLRYDEIIEDDIALTSEDFIRPEPFLAAIEKLRKENTTLIELKETELNNKKGKIDVLTTWLEKSNINKNDTKSMLEKIKDKVFSNLKPDHIEAKYYRIIEKIQTNYS
jgi:predicted ATP-dependent endonuclease of OLD family